MSTPAIDSFELIQSEMGGLVLKRPGRADVANVRLRRAFPLTHGSRYISVGNADGKELLIIDDLEQLDGDTRLTIERALNNASFVPKIERVNEVDVRFGYQQWNVVTDRGAAEFRVQEREDIRFLPDGRFRIKDADGNVYEMPALKQLDEASRRAVEALV